MLVRPRSWSSTSGGILTQHAPFYTDDYFVEKISSGMYFKLLHDRKPQLNINHTTNTTSIPLLPAEVAKGQAFPSPLHCFYWRNFKNISCS